MALDSYTGLKSAIQDWLIRPDLVNVVDTFIDLCESELNYSLRTRHQLTTVALTPDSDGYVDLPADYLEFRQVTALTNPRRVLQNVAPSYRDWAYDRSSGYPAVFSISGDEMLVLPLTASNIELEYYAKIPALSATTTTNWVLQRCPALYLYGSVRHAMGYIQDDERMALAQGIFQSTLDQIKADERGAMYARAAARVSGPTP